MWREKALYVLVKNNREGDDFKAMLTEAKTLRVPTGLSRALPWLDSAAEYRTILGKSKGLVGAEAFKVASFGLNRGEDGRPVLKTVLAIKGHPGFEQPLVDAGDYYVGDWDVSVAVQSKVGGHYTAATVRFHVKALKAGVGGQAHLAIEQEGAASPHTSYYFAPDFSAVKAVIQGSPQR